MTRSIFKNAASIIHQEWIHPKTLFAIRAPKELPEEITALFFFYQDLERTIPPRSSLLGMRRDPFGGLESPKNRDVCQMVFFSIWGFQFEWVFCVLKIVVVFELSYRKCCWKLDFYIIFECTNFVRNWKTVILLHNRTSVVLSDIFLTAVYLKYEKYLNTKRYLESLLRVRFLMTSFQRN